jgi:hypothetical protein
MALPRKQSRLLVVAGQTFRWRLARRRVGSERRYFWPEHLYVQRARGAGQRLVVRFGYPVWHFVAGQRQYPTPGLVERIVRAALSAGWCPDQGGLAPFEMDGQAYLVPADSSTYG